MLPTWRQALDAPGAAQLTLLKKIFMDRKEWWHLVPDQDVFASGGETTGQVLNLAARHKDGRWAMVYCATQASFTVNMSKLAGAEVEAFWVDPRNAESAPIGRFANTGVESFSTPNGWEDALLILEAE